MSIVHIAFYPSDWLAGTRGMSDAETGVYITLVARMYEMAGPIERDDERLSRLCGCKTKSSFLKSLKYLIAEGKVIEVDGGLFNERVEKEIKNTTEKSSKAKAAAQSRWDKKANKIKGGADADASPKHMPQPCQSEPESEPYTDTPSPTSNTARQNPGGGRGDVQDFRERILMAVDVDPVSGMAGPNGRMIGTSADMLEANRWLNDLNLSEPECLTVIAEVMALKRDGPPSNFRYFNSAMQRYAAHKSQPALTPIEGGKAHDRTATHRPDRVQRIVAAGAEGTSGKDWG